MKQKTTILLLAATAFAACSKDTAAILNEESQIPIRIASHSRIQTRMANNQFENNDGIGLFVLQQPNSLADERHADNVQFICQNGSWTSAQTVYYPSATGLCDFIAYYPYASNALPQASSIMECNVAADQSNPADYSRSDFLVAERNSVTPSSEAVSLVFKHRMAEIWIEINPGGVFNSAEELLALNPTVTIKGACTKGQYDFGSKAFSNPADKTDIIPYGTFSVTDGKLTGKRAIVVPQEIPGNQLFIEMQAGGKTYNFTFGENHSIHPATKETYTLTLKGSQPQAHLEAQIDNWENESHIEGAFEESTGATGNGNYYFSLPDFSQSAVYRAMAGNQPVAEICKEYLSNSIVRHQAIVVYPIRDGRADLQQGYVAQVLDASTGQPAAEALHGGTIAWNDDNNSFDYRQGTSVSATTLYMSGGEIHSTPSGNEAVELLAAPYLIHDARDDKAYKVVKIGTQYWMAEDLAAKQFRNDEDIPNLESEALWTTAIENSAAAYCIHEGHYYYTYAVAQGDIAPEGWTMPRSDDWERLAAYIDEDTSLITIREGSSNLTGLSIEGTGYRDETGAYPPHTFPTTYVWTQESTYCIDQGMGMRTWKNQGNIIRCIRE